MKTKFTLLLMAFAMGGLISTATAGPDMQALELRRQIAESHRAAKIASTSGGDVVHYVASPSGKGGVVSRKDGATTNIALFKSKVSKTAMKDCADVSCCVKPSCADAACCAKVK
jgi:hypothetical protein